ncbi:KilA-N domain-containing protein [Acinetobacter sp. ANC 5045]|uniref:KilA-N domain-containing protein n=1 Tax=Acinetobacter sp. ANC 5045 TaxID=2529851 RepID=UPI00103C0D2D|nr:KilA-N domain-containing protein [Acinetobacter sp. ANC 5045]TCB10968.1 KilA-N domain-containing protein [Acinetobacter sp. ANC 5045]
MSNLTQNLVNPNTQPLVIGDFSIRQDEEGRYSLADLHKASGNLAKHKPSNFLRVEQTQELINEIEQFSDMRSAVKVINGGNNRGTYAVKEMVYSYAMWISAKFHLMVIRAYDAMVMQTKVNSRQVITPEQKDTLHKIVDHKVNGNQGLRAQVWTRHNRHFKINSYHELLAIHFDDAVKYLLEMEVKQRAEKQEVKALPYPQEVIHVAQQISNEFNNSRYDSWHVSARNGVLTAMPLPPGFYPTMDIAEFTKRFDSVLDLLYGTDTLRVGRHFLRERNSN